MCRTIVLAFHHDEQGWLYTLILLCYQQKWQVRLPKVYLSIFLYIIFEYFEFRVIFSVPWFV